MTDRELTPEADKALEKVYIFLLRKRRERLARQANQEQSIYVTATPSGTADTQVEKAIKTEE